MHHQLLVAAVLPIVLVVAGCGGATDEAAPVPPPPAAAPVTAAYFHGDWCERYTPPHDPDEPIPSEETGENLVNLTFASDGTFRIGRSAANVRAQGQWGLDNGELRMPANSVASRVTPERISADEFRFRSLGVEFRVTRGHCPPE